MFLWACVLKLGVVSSSIVKSQEVNITSLQPVVRNMRILWACVLKLGVVSSSIVKLQEVNIASLQPVVRNMRIIEGI